MIQLKRKKGTVYLVGAGPGNPELITVRGARLIQQADVLVYDRLVHPLLIDEAPAKTEKIYVGKAAGRPSVSQDEINTILIKSANKHRCVVRLKGGDPFVFGRGGEEALALKAQGIPFEIVPGISSAIAVPAYAGIPVTHRGRAQSFTVVTGHTAVHASDVDWGLYVQTDTLVILMGLRRLQSIVEKLMLLGKPAETPAAVISQGSTVEQQTVLGTVANIATLARHCATPAIIVIGEVAALHEKLDWHYVLGEQKSAATSASVFTEHIYAVSA